MSRDLKIVRRTATVQDVFVGEGYFNLSLPIGQLEDLQDLTGCGPAALVGRFDTGNWKVKDVTETIRLALIGGGMDPQRAFEIVERTIKAGNLALYLLDARTALVAALLGPEDEETEPVGEPEAPSKTQMGESSGDPSTNSQAPRTTRRRKSAK